MHRFRCFYQRKKWFSYKKNAKIQNTEIIYFIHYQFIICNYLDHQIRINRGMLNQTQEFKEKLKTLGTRARDVGCRGSNNQYFIHILWSAFT